MRSAISKTQFEIAIKKLNKEKELLEKQLNAVKSALNATTCALKYEQDVSKAEADMKNNLMFFLIGKGLLAEWQEWVEINIAEKLKKEIESSIKLAKKQA